MWDTVSNHTITLISAFRKALDQKVQAVAHILPLVTILSDVQMPLSVEVRALKEHITLFLDSQILGDFVQDRDW